MALLKNREMDVVLRTQSYLQKLDLNPEGQLVLAEFSQFIEDCRAAKKIHLERSAVSTKKYRQTDKGREVQREASRVYNRKLYHRNKEIKALAEEIAQAIPDPTLKNEEQIALLQVRLKSDPGALIPVMEGYPDIVAKLYVLNSEKK